MYSYTHAHTHINKYAYIYQYTYKQLYTHSKCLIVSIFRTKCNGLLHKACNNKNNNKEQHTPIAFSILKIIHIEFAFQRIMFPSRKYCEIRHFIRTSLEYINTCRLINKQYLMLLSLHSSYIFQIHF